MGGERRCKSFVFFFNDTATTEIYTLSLHDALPIYGHALVLHAGGAPVSLVDGGQYIGHAAGEESQSLDRKSTRLNSSHVKRSRMPSSA